LARLTDVLGIHLRLEEAQYTPMLGALCRRIAECTLFRIEIVTHAPIFTSSVDEPFPHMF
jgi:hypothetical protein